jgi:phospholipid transport system substrate-binding protein
MTSTNSRTIRNRSIRLASLGARAAAAAWLLLSCTASAGAIEPRDVVRDTTERILTVLRDSTLSLDQKRSQIEEIAYQRFDWDRIARLVLARNWTRMTLEQQKEFIVQFKRHLSLTYGERLGDYTGETVEVGESRVEANGDVTVMTKLLGGSRDGVAIAYRMRANGESWLVLDVIIENISLIQNFRAQIQEIVSSKGPDEVIDLLRKKNAERAQAKS